MKKAAVLGAGGFIGSHLVNYLKKQGYYVRAVDKKYPEFSKPDYDIFRVSDLTELNNVRLAVANVDEVYQLAAEMGGMNFISKEHLASYQNSNLINTYVAQACKEAGVNKLFFSSSACVYPLYRQSDLNDLPLTEADAYPAMPNEAYGWEKLFAEQRYLEYAKQGAYGVRIARFENCYGINSTFEGGREKAPAALCRKIALANDGDEIEVWGDGQALRSFMQVKDCVRGIYQLMQSDIDTPVSLGSDEVVSVNQLAQMIIDVSGKKLTIKNIDGPEGVRARRIDHAKAQTELGWSASIRLEGGIKELYDWVSRQIH